MDADLETYEGLRQDINKLLDELRNAIEKGGYLPQSTLLACYILIASMIRPSLKKE